MKNKALDDESDDSNFGEIENFSQDELEEDDIQSDESSVGEWEEEKWRKRMEREMN